MVAATIFTFINRCHSSTIRWIFINVGTIVKTFHSVHIADIENDVLAISKMAAAAAILIMLNGTDTNKQEWKDLNVKPFPNVDNEVGLYSDNAQDDERSHIEFHRMCQHCLTIWPTFNKLVGIV